MGRPTLLRLTWAFLTFVLLFVSSVARAGSYTPPSLRGHVVDEAGALNDQQVRRLDRKLDRVRQDTGFAIVVFILPNVPEGMSIEDLGYQVGNAWGVGSKKGDDGVLLIATTLDRKLRIETGKGAGGALTDVASSHIIERTIAPLMKQGRTYEAMNRGVDAIVQEMTSNQPEGSAAGRGPAAAGKAGPGDIAKLVIGGVVIVGVIILAIVSPAFREMLFLMLLFGRFGGGGRGRDDDDDDRGSGYGGGGGSFGGGGASGDY